MDSVKDVADIPQRFVKEGTQVRASLLLCRVHDDCTDLVAHQFVNRCVKPDKKGECRDDLDGQGCIS